MKFFLSIKFHTDHSNASKINSIINEAKNCGNEMISIYTDYQDNGSKEFQPNELMKITFDVIKECDAFIVDLTEKGVGLGIEAGYAFANNIPVYIIAKTGSNISDTLKGISTKIFTYNSTSELKEFFSKISNF